MSNNANGLLRDSRVYLSGPMDFVASRAVEKATGWRNRIGQFLQSFGVTVFDPWQKPEIYGMQDYGVEGEATTDARAGWSYEGGPEGAAKRAKVAESFWPALHVDLRMVDTSDFIVCYCPTNIYSVGTPHEIILAREQRKPVLFVSPYVVYPELEALRKHLANDKAGKDLLQALVDKVPIKENKNASPSLWYMPLIGGEHFFDGFGFHLYKEKFDWPDIPLDENESLNPPKRPLLPFLEGANTALPKKWNRHTKSFVDNDDWLLWKLESQDGGAAFADVQPQEKSA